MRNKSKCELLNCMAMRNTNLPEETGCIYAQFSKQLKEQLHFHADTQDEPCKCCLLNFIFYLTNHCRDTEGLIHDLQQLVHNNQDRTSEAP